MAKTNIAPHFIVAWGFPITNPSQFSLQKISWAGAVKERGLHLKDQTKMVGNSYLSGPKLPFNIANPCSKILV